MAPAPLQKPPTRKKSLVDLAFENYADVIGVLLVALVAMYLVERTTALAAPFVTLSHNVTDFAVVNATGGVMKYTTGGADALYVFFALLCVVSLRDVVVEIMSRVCKGFALDKLKLPLVINATFELLFLGTIAAQASGEVGRLGAFRAPSVVVSAFPQVMATAHKVILLFLVAFWLHGPLLGVFVQVWGLSVPFPAPRVTYCVFAAPPARQRARAAPRRRQLRAAARSLRPWVRCSVAP